MTNGQDFKLVSQKITLLLISQSQLTLTQLSKLGVVPHQCLIHLQHSVEKVMQVVKLIILALVLAPQIHVNSAGLIIPPNKPSHKHQQLRLHSLNGIKHSPISNGQEFKLVSLYQKAQMVSLLISQRQTADKTLISKLTVVKKLRRLILHQDQ